MAAAKGPKTLDRPADDEIPEDREMPEGDKPMTFWEHLEDLRTRIVRSAIFFLIGFGLAYWKKEELLDFISIPYCDAWRREAVEGKCALNFAAPHAAFMSYAKLAAIVGLAALLSALAWVASHTTR